MAESAPSTSMSSARQVPQLPGTSGPHLNLGPSHQLVKVECAKCKAHLNVSTRSHTFTCPNDSCRQLQALPAELRMPAEGAQAAVQSIQVCRHVSIHCVRTHIDDLCWGRGFEAEGILCILPFRSLSCILEVCLTEKVSQEHLEESSQKH